jgi:hypothetical protein
MISATGVADYASLIRSVACAIIDQAVSILTIKRMKTCFGLLLLMALATASFAGEIQKGAAMQVKPDSIWFSDTGKLASWQKLKKSGKAKAVAAHEAKLLSRREAWQFNNTLAVKILSYEPDKNRVNVEMTTEGRLLGSTWFLDPNALVQ